MLAGRVGFQVLVRMGTLRLWVERYLNPRVEVSGLGLGGLQEVVFHGMLKRAGRDKGAGRVDIALCGRVAVFILHGAALLAYEDGVL